MNAEAKPGGGAWPTVYDEQAMLCRAAASGARLLRLDTSGLEPFREMQRRIDREIFSAFGVPAHILRGQTNAPT